jgi:hypothetical protein
MQIQAMTNSNYYISIPTYNIFSEEWTETVFDTKEQYKEFAWSHFKEPGFYNLQHTKLWKQNAIHFDEKGYYCKSVKKSRDYNSFWDFEKKKSVYTGGVIYEGTQRVGEGVTKFQYFVPGLYYFYLNYCPIFDKILKIQKFPDIWDSDLHFFMYILLCLLEGKHSIVVKKRQAGYTYKHDAILTNTIWFNKGFTNKIFAADKEHVENAWKFISNYRNHLNTHTGWYRNFNPDKTLDWQQKIQVDENGRKVFKGNMSVLRGFTTEKDPAKGVGGANSIVYGEESGMNDTLDITHEYLLPAVTIGNVTTGLVMYSGSVGELEKCDPLKKMFYKPEEHGFLGVPNIWDDDKQGTLSGFFVPEYWSYPGCIDEDGNSDVEKAKELIEQEKEKNKKKGFESYRLYCSQHPSSPNEAFAWRQESIFPIHLVRRQSLRIETERMYGTPTELYHDENGHLKDRMTTKVPISEFPCKSEDKEGAIVVWERPPQNPRWGEYFAAVDPVVEGRTETSKSLFSIYIYRNLTEIVRQEGDGVIKVLEGDKIVASWTGRFDDVRKTNERAEKLIEWYNAITLVENNVTSFIQHMISKKKQRYLVRKNEIPFLKELQANKSVFQEYGIRTTEVIKTYLLTTMVEYVQEEIGILHKDDGTELRTIYGIERIPDIMLLKEMEAYHDKLNVDRIISFGLVLALARSMQASGRIGKREEIEKKVDKKLYNINKSPFKNIGGYNIPSEKFIKPSFKNLK